MTQAGMYPGSKEERCDGDRDRDGSRAGAASRAPAASKPQEPHGEPRHCGTDAAMPCDVPGRIQPQIKGGWEEPGAAHMEDT